MTPDPTWPAHSPGVGDLPERVFRWIVDETAHSFLVIRRDGTICYAGGSISRLLGWDAEAARGRNMAEFLAPEDIPQALAAIAEIDEVDRTGAGVPMVFTIVRPDGQPTWVEVGAMPLLDDPEVDGIVLRLQAWDASHHLDDFLVALLADESVPAVLAALCRSIAASLEAEGAVVHYGFDGTSFAGAEGFAAPVELVRSDAGPWRTAVVGDEMVSTDVTALDAPLSSVAGEAGFRACWAVPVPVAAGVAPAALSIWRATPGSPLIGHRHVLQRAARYVQLALVRTAEHQRLRYLAGHDSLTGAANRAEFRARLAHAVAIGEEALAVAFCDLDQFKPVNDTYGHQAGDAVLIEVADRLRSCLRAGDELARIGGDEFTAMLRNVPDPEAARHVADRLLAALAEPIDVGGDLITLGLSVGLVLAEPGATADDLLNRADDALYLAKRAGGTRAHVAG